MTDLLSPADTPTVKIVPIPTRPTPVVRAAHRRHGPDRPAPTPARARRGGRRGRWTFVIVLAVMDATLAMVLIGTVLFPLSPVPDGAPPASSVPSSVVVPSTVGGGDPVAAHASPRVRPPGGRDGGAVATAASTSTTEAVPPVVHDAAPARGQTLTTQGPAGGPASTTTAVPSTAPPTAPVTVPVTVPPETTPPSTEPPQTPDTTPTTIEPTIPEETAP